jgi:hypothetical protein
LYCFAKVHPDSNLVKQNRKKATKKECTPKKIESLNLKLRPLEFVEVKKSKNDEAIKVAVGQNRGDKLAQEKFNQHNDDPSDELDKWSTGLCNLFEDVNESKRAEESMNAKTPSRYKVYVQDTPVEFYGLSIRERRRLGLDC